MKTVTDVKRHKESFEYTSCVDLDPPCDNWNALECDGRNKAAGFGCSCDCHWTPMGFVGGDKISFPDEPNSI